jgi:hypothetical protein
MDDLFGTHRVANRDPGRSWLRLAFSSLRLALSRWRWWLSTTAQASLPHRRPPSSGWIRHRRHRRVAQQTVISNLSGYARTGTRKTTRPKISHAITHHNDELRGVFYSRRCQPRPLATSVRASTSWLEDGQSLTRLPSQSISSRSSCSPATIVMATTFSAPACPRRCASDLVSAAVAITQCRARE